MALRRSIAILLVAPMFGCAAPQEPPLASLYAGKAIVTGTEASERPRGFGESLVDVLVKVSGDPRLIDDPRVAPLAARAATFVAGFSYRDRMEGIPVHDEQGTRDRPYDLSVRFDRARIDDALRALGRSPWLGTRPRLGVFLAVAIGPTTYVLAAEGERGYDQRQALLDAASRRGVPIVLPKPGDLAAAGLRVDTLAVADLASLDAVGRTIGGDRALAGRMTWNPSASGWDAAWRLAANGTTHRWAHHDVTFDQAYRRAMGAAAQILSGNGPPDAGR